MQRPFHSLLSRHTPSLCVYMATARGCPPKENKTFFKKTACIFSSGGQEVSPLLTPRGSAARKVAGAVQEELHEVLVPKAARHLGMRAPNEGAEAAPGSWENSAWFIGKTAANVPKALHCTTRGEPRGAMGMLRSSTSTQTKKGECVRREKNRERERERWGVGSGRYHDGRLAAAVGGVEVGPAGHEVLGHLLVARRAHLGGRRKPRGREHRRPVWMNV